MASTSVAFPEMREKASIHYGEECKAKSMELIQSFRLPGGLLPLDDIVEAGHVEETGFVWVMITKKQQEHYFKKADRWSSYKEEITCYLQKNRMKNIKGVKSKEFLTWVPINEIYIDEANPQRIHFKSIAGLSRSFPTLFFAPESA